MHPEPFAAILPGIQLPRIGGFDQYALGGNDVAKIHLLRTVSWALCRGLDLDGAGRARSSLRRHTEPAAIREPGHALDGEGRVALLRGRRPWHALFAAGADRRLQLQQARSRLALQDRQFRAVPRVE